LPIGVRTASMTYTLFMDFDNERKYPAFYAERLTPNT
jgi:hypothetical protein